MQNSVAKTLPMTKSNLEMQSSSAKLAAEVAQLSESILARESSWLGFQKVNKWN